MKPSKFDSRFSLKSFTIQLMGLLFIPLTLYSCSAEPTVQKDDVTGLAGITGTNDDHLADQVIIRRTDYGVPHIQAENMRAAGYALGYVQMEDYAERVIELLLKARGEWAKYNELDPGEREEALDSDAVNRLEYERAVETWQFLQQDTRDFNFGFAEGVNRYIELHPEEFEDRKLPEFSPYDVHARGIGGPSTSAIRSFLSAHRKRMEKKSEDPETSAHNWYGELNPYEDLMRLNSVLAKTALRVEDPHPDVGSNVWAFAPDRITTGNAILVRNPHLSWDAGYYEAQVTVPGVFNFYGDFRIGQALGIIGGFNERLGWATTNNNPNLDEIYSFEADPEKPDHFLLDGASIPLKHKQVTVEFRHGEAIGRETREFWFTALGPVFHREGGKIYVIRSANDGQYRVGEQFLEMMKAQNLEEWKEAMKIRSRTSSNLTYADADGNIYYVWNATSPKLPHAPGGDTLAVHISETDQAWLEHIDWDQLPRLHNPEGGYLRNENDTFHFTNLNEVFDPEDFPENFPEPNLRLRSQHSLHLIHDTDLLSLEEIVELKHSMGMLLADRVKEDLLEAVRQTQPEGEVRRALEHLEQWDNSVTKDSRGGVLFKTWWWRYQDTADTVSVRSTPESAGFSATAEKLFEEPWSPDRPVETPYGLADPERAVEAFEWAIEGAKERYGDWDLAWGDVHRARIGDLDLPVGGCTGQLGCFRVLWFTDHEEDEKKLQVRGGDGWVFAVEFGEVPRAYSILAYGQSIKEDSPHFNDQIEMFTNNQMKRVFFTEDEVRMQTIREYRPGQE